MQIQANIPLLEEILAPYRKACGAAFAGYRNHVYRMIHYSLALEAAAGRTVSPEDFEKFVIAGAFHDLGLFTENTVDYLPPSAALARAYLEDRGRSDGTGEIAAMIDNHHKLTPYAGEFPLAEVFRRGDLADFSLGLFRSGLPRATLRAVRAAFPNAGFHLLLVKVAAKWVLRHPLNPAPIFKW